MTQVVAALTRHEGVDSGGQFIEYGGPLLAEHGPVRLRPGDRLSLVIRAQSGVDAEELEAILQGDGLAATEPDAAEPPIELDSSGAEGWPLAAPPQPGGQLI